MGRNIPTRSSYEDALRSRGINRVHNVTRHAEETARITGKLNSIVDPAVDPIRFSKIRLDPYQKQWVATIGCPIDIEVSGDTTGSLGRTEVDTQMRVLPDLYEACAEVLPGYDPQLCLGIFGDCEDDFVMCRPQFEMEAGKIIDYLRVMAPQLCGGANNGEDPQYAMFARAYLTNAYTNRIGLKGYHFITTDEPCHERIDRRQILRIFGKDIFETDLKQFAGKIPSIEQVIKDLKRQTHQFILVLEDECYQAAKRWRSLCGEQSVIRIQSTRQLPGVVSAIIGLTEGILDFGNLAAHLAKYGCEDLETEVSKVELGAQAKLRHALLHPVPKRGDIFAEKGELWPIGNIADTAGQASASAADEIAYL